MKEKGHGSPFPSFFSQGNLPLFQFRRQGVRGLFSGYVQQDKFSMPPKRFGDVNKPNR